MLSQQLITTNGPQSIALVSLPFLFPLFIISKLPGLLIHIVGYTSFMYFTDHLACSVTRFGTKIICFLFFPYFHRNDIQAFFDNGSQEIRLQPEILRTSEACNSFIIPGFAFHVRRILFLFGLNMVSTLSSSEFTQSATGNRSPSTQAKNSRHIAVERVEISSSFQ